MKKWGEAEKISFNLWLTARAHPPLLQPFFVIFYAIMPKLMIKIGWCFLALFQDHIKFCCEVFSFSPCRLPIHRHGGKFWRMKNPFRFISLLKRWNLFLSSLFTLWGNMQMERKRRTDQRLLKIENEKHSTGFDLD
jgi:hypothetical protein